MIRSNTVASTTTQLIQTIDPTFPVSGRDNDSEGFRNNFNIIQKVLLNINTATESLQVKLTALSGNTVNVDAPFVTGTNLVAKGGTVLGNRTITAGYNNNTVISSGGGAGNIVLSVNTVPTNIIDYFAATGNLRADYIYLKTAQGILNSSTFVINGNSYSTNTIDYSANTCTTTPAALIADLEATSPATPVLFTNPFPTGAFQIVPIPVGIITMWYGISTNVPTGWAICNGTTVNGYVTPDLRNSFVIGAYSDSNGVSNTTVTGTASKSGGSKDLIVPSHTHDITDPGHDHTGADFKYLLKPPYINSLTGFDRTGSGSEQAVGPGDGGTMDSKTTGIDVSITGSSATNANLPPFFALYYIMKVT